MDQDAQRLVYMASRLTALALAVIAVVSAAMGNVFGFGAGYLFLKFAAGRLPATGRR